MLALFANSNHSYSSLFCSSYLHLAPFLGSLIVLQLHNWLLIFGESTVLDSAKPFWQICSILSCIFNLISENATERQDCCIIVSDQFLSCSTAALNFSYHKRVFPEWQEVEVEREIVVSKTLQMKVIIPKQDKEMWLLLLHDACVPEEEDLKRRKVWIEATLSKKNQIQR